MICYLLHNMSTVDTDNMYQYVQAAVNNVVVII